MDNLLNSLGGGEQLWMYIKKYAVNAGVETTRVVLELYYVMKSPSTPTTDKAIIASALAYQLLPKDLLSTKKLGLLGLIDNGAALYLAYKKVKQRVTPEITVMVNEKLAQWFDGNGNCTIGRLE